jgi:hypothetical protein
VKSSRPRWGGSNPDARSCESIPVIGSEVLDIAQQIPPEVPAANSGVTGEQWDKDVTVVTLKCL